MIPWFLPAQTIASPDFQAHMVPRGIHKSTDAYPATTSAPIPGSASFRLVHAMLAIRAAQASEGVVGVVLLGRRRRRDVGRLGRLHAAPLRRHQLGLLLRAQAPHQLQ